MDNIDNIKSVKETLVLALKLEDSEMYEAFADLYTAWGENLCCMGMKLLEPEPLNRMVQYRQLHQSITEDLKNILSLEDIELLAQLQVIRKKSSKHLLAVATGMLSKIDRAKLKKMVILQNISNGEKSIDRPWEKKAKKAPPKRREFTKELLAKI